MLRTKKLLIKTIVFSIIRKLQGSQSKTHIVDEKM